jgi:AcrR family transcriptional regulator
MYNHRMGLRERKKEQTRERIANTARDLFVERGFDRVTVAEIARAADVSEKTVFNYFPAKEDLFYWRMESFEDELLRTVRQREPGESIVAAFRRFLLSQSGLLGKHEPAAREQLTRITEMILESPALRAREDQVLSGYTASLAAVIAEETGARPGSVEPRVVANALMGVHRALIDYTRSRIAEGKLTPRLHREVRAQGEKALARLEEGLEGYGAR